ncbi:MAG: endonuclease/exonuclease/phosphatase family protein [Fimbriimonadales bacterium]|nr:endonuclease/exonuclease/phosphatase family protein [Fimbriimonadales bacterium]MDW8051127.1 endonuclease/exonuclease/phosphatase family protein [Armatimonadota bacterium]
MKGAQRVWLVVGLALLVPLALATEVRIVSWNIARAVGANNPRSGQAPFVAKTLNYLRPDIIVLQEVGGDTRVSWNAFAQEAALDAFVRNNLTYLGTNPQRNRDYYLYVNRLSDGWVSNAIISLYPFRTITDVSIGAPYRGLTIGLIDVPGTNGLGVFGVHFDSGGDDGSSARRQTNAENTRNQVRNWRLRNRNSAYVLGGDLNENEDPDLNPVRAINSTLPDGRLYAPISTVMSARLRDPVPVDALGGKRTWRVADTNSALRHRFDYLLVSPTEPGRDRIVVLEASLFNTRRFPAGQLPPGFAITDSQNASDHTAVFLHVRIDRWRSLPGGGGEWVPEPGTLLILVVFTGGALYWRRSWAR